MINRLEVKDSGYYQKYKDTNLYFLTELNKIIDLNNLKDAKPKCAVSGDSFSICMKTTEFSYIWDSISLIQKRLSKHGWDFRMTSYFMSQGGTYNYTWTIKKTLQ